MQLPRRSMLALAPQLAVLAVATAGTAANLPSRSVQARFATTAGYRAHPSRTDAVAYDRRWVPVGSWVRVTELANDLGGVTVRLAVRGLAPDASYRALVHVSRCGAVPSSAGAPFMNSPASGQYDANELPLAFRTGPSGAASAAIVRDWGIGTGQRAGSVVIDARGGAPVACVTVPFARLNPGW